MGTALTHAPADALQLIQEQHDRVAGLISQLEDDDLSGEQKLGVFHELARLLTAHMTMEELLFYPAVRATQTQEILLDPAEEHLAIRRALIALVTSPFGDPRFEARLAILRLEFEHHAREEEEEVLFPELCRRMSEDERAVLGEQMRALFDRLLSRAPRADVGAVTPTFAT